MRRKILVIEDEPGIRLAVKDELEFEGFDVELADDGPGGLAAIRRTRPDLILLDLMLPGRNGFQICEDVRAQGLRTPIIVITARNQEADKVRGLEQGRPVGMEALVLRDPLLQRVMVSVVVNPARISGVDEAGALAFERFLLDPSTQARIRQFRHHGLTEQTWWPAGRNNAGAELSQF